MKKILRFVFPFLFKRNWYDGTWELSRPRVIACAMLFALLAVGIFIAYLLQAPVMYIAG